MARTISQQFEKQVDDLLRTADDASKSLVSRTEEAGGLYAGEFGCPCRPARENFPHVG